MQDESRTSYVTMMSQYRLIYAEKMAMGVKPKKLAVVLNTKRSGVISVVELTRIELATS